MKLQSIYSITSLLLLAGLITMSSCNKKTEYAVSKVIPEKAEQDSLLLRIITVIEEHIPDTVAKEDRFHPEHQEFFKTRLDRYKFVYLYKNEQGEYLYYVTKPAYGVPELSVGLAGKFKLDEKNHLVDFEESYRLYRMPPEVLDKKSWEVYQAFVKGEDLQPFHRSLDTDPYIEFPNDHVAYDKKKLDWYFIKRY
ncbi:MAG: hypothetical protein JWM14_1099 [Chitinophagaceae bacterium]|nr:hypothetical protein [Chitinophagaceae bacterium]